MFQALSARLIRRIHKSIFKPGHFYSPIPDMAELERDWNRIFEQKAPGDVDLNPAGQLDLARRMAAHHTAWMDFPTEAGNGRRYYFPNNFFVRGDALVFAGMLLEHKPKRIVEVGSGFSSALMLDVNQQFLGNSIQATFIDPYPDRIELLFTPEDKKRHKVLVSRVQDVPLSVFAELEAGDIYFVDSSHVSKVGSDLNYELFDVLPVLKPGVIIHFHDILYPFEYPQEWVREGRFWNEAYLLRAFLMNNKDYEIITWLDYLLKEQRAGLAEAYPQLNTGGGSIWLRKKA